MAINMQSYLSALLLILLLLVDNSLSFSIPPTITRPVEAIDEVLNKKPATQYLWDRVLQPIKDRNSKPELPNALPRVNQNIPGLSRIKDYLSQFGYLQDTGPYNDVLDMHTISAIRAYQKFFKLQVTGDLNTETIQQMSLPRCGVPDLNFEYNLTTSHVSWPKGKPQWFPVGTKNLTYGFHPASKMPPNKTKVFRDAFTRWSQTTRLVNFTESLKYDDADIKIGSYNFREGADDAVIGDSVIVRLQSGVKTGVIRLDSSKKLWMVGEGNYSEGKFDLETTAMHQIGHLLGLEHSNNTDSVMYPAILQLQQRKVLITDSDNETIHQLYTADTNSRSISATSGSFALFGSSSGLITTFSLGFVYMALSL